MFAPRNVLSLALAFFFSQALGQPEGETSSGMQLDVKSQDSIKLAAKSLASGLITAYKSSLASKDGGVPGLFDGDHDIYFWESGAIWNAMLGYSYLTGDATYDGAVSEALQFQLGDHDAFMPANQTKVLANDDQSCWGLAAMTAAEIGFAKPKGAEWVDYAKNVWQTQHDRINLETSSACEGGLRWQIFAFNTGYNYYETLSNGNFFLLSTRLAKYTGNATYASWADKTFKWSQTVGLVDKDFHVFDGTDGAKNCSQLSKLQWTAAHGIYTEGAALMYNMTGAQNWTNIVKGLVNSSSVFKSTKDSNVIIESACETNGKCDMDQRAYKGIFARTFARAALAAPIVADPINQILTNSAKGAAMACTTGEDPMCRLSWADPDSSWETATATEGNVGEVYAALEVIQALLYPSAKGLKSTNGSATTGNSNSAGNTTHGTGASGAAAPQHTGAAGSVVAHIAAVLAVASVIVLSC